MTAGNSLARYVLSDNPAAWLTRWYGPGAVQPQTVAPNEAASIIMDAIGNGLITGGPAEIYANCIADDDESRTGGRSSSAPATWTTFWPRRCAAPPRTAPKPSSPTPS